MLPLRSGRIGLLVVRCFLPAASAVPLTFLLVALVPVVLLLWMGCRAAGEHIDSPLHRERVS